MLESEATSNNMSSSAAATIPPFFAASVSQDYGSLSIPSNSANICLPPAPFGPPSLSAASTAADSAPSSEFPASQPWCPQPGSNSTQGRMLSVETSPFRGRAIHSQDCTPPTSNHPEPAALPRPTFHSAPPWSHTRQNPVKQLIACNAEYCRRLSRVLRECYFQKEAREFLSRLESLSGLSLRSSPPPTLDPTGTTSLPAPSHLSHTLLRFSTYPSSLQSFSIHPHDLILPAWRNRETSASSPCQPSNFPVSDHLHLLSLLAVEAAVCLPAHAQELAQRALTLASLASRVSETDCGADGLIPPAASQEVMRLCNDIWAASYPVDIWAAADGADSAFDHVLQTLSGQTPLPSPRTSIRSSGFDPTAVRPLGAYYSVDPLQWPRDNDTVRACVGETTVPLSPEARKVSKIVSESLAAARKAGSDTECAVNLSGVGTIVEDSLFLRGFPQRKRKLVLPSAEEVTSGELCHTQAMTCPPLSRGLLPAHVFEAFQRSAAAQAVETAVGGGVAGLVCYMRHFLLSVESGAFEDIARLSREMVSVTTEGFRQSQVEPHRGGRGEHSGAWLPRCRSENEMMGNEDEDGTRTPIGGVEQQPCRRPSSVIADGAFALMRGATTNDLEWPPPPLSEYRQGSPVMTDANPCRRRGSGVSSASATSTVSSCGGVSSASTRSTCAQRGLHESGRSEELVSGINSTWSSAASIMAAHAPLALRPATVSQKFVLLTLLDVLCTDIAATTAFTTDDNSAAVACFDPREMRDQFSTGHTEGMSDETAAFPGETKSSTGGSSRALEQQAGWGWYPKRRRL